MSGGVGKGGCWTQTACDAAGSIQIGFIGAIGGAGTAAGRTTALGAGVRTDSASIGVDSRVGIVACWTGVHA